MSISSGPLHRVGSCFAAFLFLLLVSVAVSAAAPPACELNPGVVPAAADDPDGTVLKLVIDDGMLWPAGPWGEAAYDLPRSIDLKRVESDTFATLVRKAPAAYLDGTAFKSAPYALEDAAELPEGVWSLVDLPTHTLTLPVYTLSDAPPVIETDAKLTILAGDSTCADRLAYGATIADFGVCLSELRVDAPDGWFAAVSADALLQIRLSTGESESATESLLIARWLDVDDGARQLVLYSGVGCQSVAMPTWYGEYTLSGEVRPYGLETGDDPLMRFEIDLGAATREVDALYTDLTKDEAAGGCAAFPRTPWSFTLLMLLIVLALRRRVVSLFGA